MQMPSRSPKIGILTNAQKNCKKPATKNSIEKPRYYISLMDIAQNLIFITLCHIYFKLLMILFSI